MIQIEEPEMLLRKTSNTYQDSMASGSDNDISSNTTSERLLKSRCKSEKKRRDKLNLFIKDLQFMLYPDTSKRLDKLTVLKMTVDYLNSRSDFTINVNGNKKQNKSFFIPCDELGQLMFETTNGFIIVINEDAKFLYVADVAEKVLGIKVSSITGKPIHSFIHEDDRPKVTDKIMSGIINFDSNNDSSKGQFYMENTLDKNTVSLDFRLLVKPENSEPKYQRLYCTGQWQTLKESETGRYESKALILLACTKTDFRHIAPPTDSVMSFSSRHGLDGSFIFADQNCPSIVGYTPYELFGKSIYKFVHTDDLSNLSSVHEKLTKKCEKEVEIYFRFLSKGNEWLLLKGTLQLTCSEETLQADCINATFSLAQQEANHQFQEYAETKRMDLLKIIQNIQMKDKDKDVQEEHKQNRDTLQKESLPEISTGIDIDCYADMDGKELEDTLEIQKILHAQLSTKHQYLRKSFEEQEKKLNSIYSIMSNYAQLMEATAFKEHYSEQLEMHEYFKYVLMKLKREQEYLDKQIQGKMKELEIRKRAIKLRNMVSRQQKVLNEIKDRRKIDEPGDFQGGRDNSFKQRPGVVSSKSCKSVKLPVTCFCKSPSIFTTMTTTASKKQFNDDGSSNLIDTTNSRYCDLPKFTNNIHKSTSSNLNTSLQLLFNQSGAAQQQSLQTETAQQQGLADNFQQISYALQLTQDHQQPTQKKQQQIQSGPLKNSLDLLKNQISEQQSSCGTNVDLQRTISKQILVHLQVLQKHVLTQLVNVMQDKREAISDFGQVLPVLQQLQQLQQSILNQQGDDKTPSIQQQANSSPAPQQQESTSLKGVEMDMTDALNYHDMQQQQQPAFSPSSTMNCSPVSSYSVRNQTSERNMLCDSSGVSLSNSNSNFFDIPEKTPGEKDSIFGNRNTCLEVLNNIKRTFSYQDLQENENNENNEYSGNNTKDCFPSISSPDLRALINDNDNNNNNGSNNDNDGDKGGAGSNNEEIKKSMTFEDDTMKYYQPFFETQQQLAQLQQYQRMQIYLQQRQHMQVVQAQNNLTQQQQQQRTSPTLSPVTGSQQSTSQAVPTIVNQRTNANPGFPTEGFNEENGNLSELPGTNFDNPSWMPGENEEVLNMLLSESDFFW